MSYNSLAGMSFQVLSGVSARIANILLVIDIITKVSFRIVARLKMPCGIDKHEEIPSLLACSAGVDDAHAHKSCSPIFGKPGSLVTWLYFRICLCLRLLPMIEIVLACRL